MSERWAETLGRLFSARRSGVVFGLERIAKVAAAMGQPERQLGRIVHVAGTNGKGSTAAFCAAMARAAGLRVAVYGSPHLTTLRERVTVDGMMLEPEAWQSALDRVHDCGGGGLTFFEQVTLVGFALIAAAKVDLTIVEVGLGGRLDATNLVDADIAIITGVAFDHQAYLGETIEEIAAEKAGICRAGKPVVIGDAGLAPGRAALLRSAAAGDADILEIDPPTRGLVEGAELGLAGAHQRDNAAAAVVAIRALASQMQNRSVSFAAPGAEAWQRLAAPSTWLRGLGEARMPGRLETLSRPGTRGPRVLLDAAHNPDGAAALAAFLAIQPETPRWLVLAVSADKDLIAMASPLIEVVDAVVCTAYEGERALGAGVVAERLRSVADGGDCAILVAAKADDAMALAGQGAGETGLVCVAGSIFLVGEIRGKYLGLVADPLAVTDPLGPLGPAR